MSLRAEQERVRALEAQLAEVRTAAARAEVEHERQLTAAHLVAEHMVRPWTLTEPEDERTEAHGGADGGALPNTSPT